MRLQLCELSGFCLTSPSAPTGQRFRPPSPDNSDKQFVYMQLLITEALRVKTSLALPCKSGIKQLERKTKEQNNNIFLFSTTGSAQALRERHTRMLGSVISGQPRVIVHLTLSLYHSFSSSLYRCPSSLLASSLPSSLPPPFHHPLCLASAPLRFLLATPINFYVIPESLPYLSLRKLHLFPRLLYLPFSLSFN